MTIRTELTETIHTQPLASAIPGAVERSQSPAAIIEAQTDEQAIAAWLRARASKSPSTLDRYRREARRFLAYIQQRGREFNKVTLNDVHAYEQALLAGQVTGRPRAPAAVDGVFNVLNSLFGLLSTAGYLNRNVLVLRKKQSGTDNTRIERFLSNAEIEALLAEAAGLERTMGTAEGERLRFVLIWFLSTGARVSETLAAPMNSVYLAPEAGESQWHWRVERKGRQRADLPLRNDAMDALARYRLHLGLARFPTPQADDGYLIWPLRGKSSQPLYRGTISQPLKAFFERAAKRVEDPVLANHMRQASTHWLRHTAATQLLDAGASMRFVSKLLGHANQAITSSVYDHGNRAAWRNELERGRAYRI